MASGGPPFELRVETHEGLHALVRALREEEDGRQLRRELARNLRAALRPAAAEAKSSIMAMSSSGLTSAPALRSSIARKIRPEIKLGGRWSGARVKAFKTPGIRNFKNAPKRTNRASGWRHPVFGNRDEWVQQHGKLLWFDRAFQGREGQYLHAVREAMDEMARRIASRVR